MSRSDPVALPLWRCVGCVGYSCQIDAANAIFCTMRFAPWGESSVKSIEGFHLSCGGAILCFFIDPTRGEGELPVFAVYLEDLGI